LPHRRVDPSFEIAVSCMAAGVGEGCSGEPCALQVRMVAGLIIRGMQG